MSKTPNRAGTVATAPPQTWIPPEQSEKADEAPLSKEQVLNVMSQQAAKFLVRKHHTSNDDFMEAKTAYQLLADMAELHGKLVRRIK